MDDAREHHANVDQLVALVRQQADETDCWKRAETVLCASRLRHHLESLHVDVTPDLATSLMATAMLLATGSEEWGGDYRDALADLAALGLELLES